MADGKLSGIIQKITANIIGEGNPYTAKKCTQTAFDKTIDRKMVSDVVFAHEEMRQKLDDIIHPAVKSYILDKIEEQKKAGCTLMIVEAALLLEDHYDAFCDKVWYIHTDQEIRI